MVKKIENFLNLKYLSLIIILPLLISISTLNIYINTLFLFSTAVFLTFSFSMYKFIWQNNIKYCLTLTVTNYILILIITLNFAINLNLHSVSYLLLPSLIILQKQINDKDKLIQKFLYKLESYFRIIHFLLLLSLSILLFLIEISIFFMILVIYFSIPFIFNLIFHLIQQKKIKFRFKNLYQYFIISYPIIVLFWFIHCLLLSLPQPGY